MPRKITQKDNSYWSNAFIAVAQVFLGVSAAVFFTSGELDEPKIRVVIFNLLLSIIFLLMGWKVSK
jgi:hypothetical protein